jgi:hypothetical protein
MPVRRLPAGQRQQVAGRGVGKVSTASDDVGSDYSLRLLIKLQENKWPRQDGAPRPASFMRWSRMILCRLDVWKRFQELSRKYIPNCSGRQTKIVRLI